MQKFVTIHHIYSILLGIAFSIIMSPYLHPIITVVLTIMLYQYWFQHYKQTDLSPFEQIKPFFSFQTDQLQQLEDCVRNIRTGTELEMIQVNYLKLIELVQNLEHCLPSHHNLWKEYQQRSQAFLRLIEKDKWTRECQISRNTNTPMQHQWLASNINNFDRHLNYD